MVILLKIAIVAGNVILDFINLKEKLMTKCYACDIKLNKKTRAFFDKWWNKYYCKKCFEGIYPDLWY